MPDVFISYHPADRAWAEWIRTQLEQEHYTVVFPDRRDSDVLSFDLEVQRAGTEARLAQSFCTP